MNGKKRDDIYQWICRYAAEMNGPTPSIREIAMAFHIDYKTAYFHVMRLVAEGRLRQERGKLVVVGSRWSAPGYQ